jgi:hypothetical protein
LPGNATEFLMGLRKEVDMRTFHVAVITTVLVVGTAVGVAGQPGEGCINEECVLAEFTGSLRFDMTCEGVGATGLACMEPAVLVPFSDSRLDGEVAITGSSSDVLGDSVLWLGSWLIGDSAAGWVETATPRLQHKGGSPRQYTSVLVGTGTHEGLYAVSDVTVSGAVFDFEGHIVAGYVDGLATRDFSGVITQGNLTELDW